MTIRSAEEGYDVALEPLTRSEIDRRMDDVVVEVAAGAASIEAMDSAALRPRPISAAELVRRMRPFLSRN